MFITFDFAASTDNISSGNSFVENKHNQSFKVQWLLYVASGSKLKKKELRSADTVIFLYGSQNVEFALYSIHQFVFITEGGCVYCALGNESLCIIQVNSSL